MKTVRDILEHKGHGAWTVEPGATVREALTEMAKREVGALVVAEGGRVVGVISERDYARKVIVKGKSSLETSVGEVMATAPSCVTPDQTIADCMSRMTNKRIRHLPVLEGDNLVGVVSIGDLVATIISEHECKIDELETLIYGS